MEALLVNDNLGVRTITINRPDDMNAVTPQMLTDLSKTLKETVRDASIRCLVLTATGRAFCVGQDISIMKSQFERGESMDFATALRNGYNPVVQRLMEMEIPVIAAVNGVAAGAGWSLALAADIRVCSDKAAFVSAFTNIGVIPDSGFTQTLPRLVGYSRAVEIAWTNDKITPERALELGLVNRVVPHEQLMAETNKLAERLAAMPTKAMGLTKRTMLASFSNDAAAQLELEATLQAVAGETADHKEGVQAFLEKRKPTFHGR